MSDAFDWARYEAEFTDGDDGVDWGSYEAEFADPDRRDENVELLLPASGGGCALIDDVDWDRYESELIGSDDGVHVERLPFVQDTFLITGQHVIGKSELARLYARRFAEAVETNPELSGLEVSQRELALFLSRVIGVDLCSTRGAMLLALIPAQDLAATITPEAVVAFLLRVRARTVMRRQPHRSPPEPSKPPGRLVARTRRPPRGPNPAQAPTVLPARGGFAIA